MIGEHKISQSFELLYLNFKINFKYSNHIIKTKTLKSSKIGDASFIGLECESGNVDDCNDGPDESAPLDCKGALILSDIESQCGSKCKLSIRSNSKTKKSWFTLWTSQAMKN